MQAQVTFVSHEPKLVDGRNGQFTVHKFKTSDGTVFDTSKTDVANAAYALLNQAVVVTYDETQNGQWTNRRITGVQAAGTTALAPGVLPSTGSSAPAPSVPPANASSGTSFYKPTHPDDAARMTRSVAHGSGLTALELALKAHELGVAEIKNPDGWATTAEWIGKKAIELGGAFGQYIFKGSRPDSSVPAVNGADSSGAVGGGDAGAAAAAPAAPAAPAEAPADDDIPF